MSRVERSRREKVTRYSVRKVSFGAASVAVAAFFMFLGNGAVYAAEPNVTATDSALAATPANNQLDENSGSSEATAPKAQADTTTPTPADASSTSVESATVSKAQADTTTSKPADATPAPVVSSTTSTTEETSEKATPALDKKQLEDYVAEIDAKLASDSYATKTDESVATLKEHLGLAKLALTTAKSQDELTKAYRRLFMTVNSGLRSKPKAQVENPKLDTTEGKATVGKKASNTEKATGTNSIANSGKHDPRNGQALDRNNPFRTDGTTTDTDPDANQVYTGLDGSDDETVEDLSNKLKSLTTSIENNDKISKQMESLGEATGVGKGEVKNIDNFGGWKAVKDTESNGKFAVARKTEKGIFPLETINTVVDINSGTYFTYLREQALDRTSNYMLYLSEVRTQASKDEPTFDGKNYQRSGLGRTDAPGIKGYNGIEKTFKAYSPTSGSKVQISFITGYSGDINGTKAKYHVQVFTSQSDTPIYDVTFDPQKDVTNDPKMTVQGASDGSSVVAERITTKGDEFTKEKLEEKMSQTQFRPNGRPGKFTSKEIDIPAGVTEYTVRISSADNQHLGMGYQSIYRHFALPISGLDFHVTQDTGGVAKSLLQKIYTKLKESEEKDKNFKTPESQRQYEEALATVDQLLQQDTKSTTEYQTILQTLLVKRQELANSDQEKPIKSKASDAIDQAKATKDKEIDANDQLSQSEKAKAKEATKAAADAAKVAIEAATDQAGVTEKETAGTNAIKAVTPVGKENAKNAIDQAKATKDKEIDANDQLSQSEKAKAKEATKAAADAAKVAIEAATDQAEVDRILRNDIYKDDAAINEVEAFDLSSLLVNGFVSVKQGETLTDQEVLSKVNLPKDVEVIKIEKPTTSALGRLVAKVTLKLSDGSVEEINVPVEVVAPQNHGNEGNGANNGANNTEAKADKAKLEAAIHQLDELLLKESAKLDAETAKEANTLLSDAKKVFANADATQAEVDAMVKRIEDFMAKVAPSTDHANTANDQSAQTPAVVPANNQSAQTTVVAPATTQAAANASQTASAQANARKAAKELPNTGTADSTVAMVAAAASALLGLGLAGRRRKEDEEA